MWQSILADAQDFIQAVSGQKAWLAGGSVLIWFMAVAVNGFEKRTGLSFNNTAKIYCPIGL